MNPYTSVWTGAAAGADGPREFHLVLLDNGRVQTLADEVGRQALRCIRCSACLNVCPVYSRVGGHAYGSVYPGPIGAILTPQLKGIEGDAGSLPYASSLCGACGDVCPVKIEIPRLLTHLRAREVASRSRLDPESLTMRALFHTFSSRDRYERAQKLARIASRPLARGGMDGARSPGRPARCPAGRSRATSPRQHRRPSANGGAAPASARHRPLRPLHPVAAHTAETGSKWVHRRARGRPATPGPTSFTASVRPSATPQPPDIPRNYRTEDERPRDEIVTLFAERVAEYRATVHRVRTDTAGGRAEVGETVRRIAEEAGARRIGIPADLPEEWRPSAAGGDRSAAEAERSAALQLIEDATLSVQELDELDGALTGCAVAIAETGTFVLDGGRGAGAARAHASCRTCTSAWCGRIRWWGSCRRPSESSRTRCGPGVRSRSSRGRPRRRTSSWIASRACMARGCSTWCSWPDAHRVPRHVGVRGNGARPARREPAQTAARRHPSGRPAWPRAQTRRPAGGGDRTGCSASRSSSPRT